MHNTLKEWLLDLENRNPKEIQLGLERIRQVAIKLNLLKLDATVISVAGTNGKGSTVATLSTIYQHAGYQVGCYISPHLIQFNERIQINNCPIEDESLISAFNRIEQARGSILLTYFEFITLAALWYFKNHSLDIIILEVGLGGRLDATAIIDSDLAIITTVDFDHMDFLGDTLDKIGFEKAGIARPQKPVVFGDTNPPTSLLDHIKQLNCPFFCHGRDFTSALKNDEFSFSSNNYQFTSPSLHLYHKSVAAALMAIICLKNILPVALKKIDEVLPLIKLPGRFHHVQKPVLTILDVAHNPQAAENLANYLQKNYSNALIYAVFSALNDKDIDGLIKPFNHLVEQWFPALLTSKRATSTNDLIKTLQKYQLNFNPCYNSPILAYEAACNAASPNHLILVYGSFLTVAEILDKQAK